MIRVLIGSVAAAIVMFVIGFIFFATPLMKLGTSSVANAEAAAIQQSLAANLPSTGTYFIPSTDTPEQTVMFGQGPIATIHFNTSGYPAADPSALVSGLILNIATALLMGAALLAARPASFAVAARIVVCFAVAAGLYMRISETVWNHDVPHFAYLFVADVLAMVAGGLVIARWFLPRRPAAAP